MNRALAWQGDFLYRVAVNDAATEPAPGPASPIRGRLIIAAKVSVAIGALGWTLSKTPLGDLKAALGRVSPIAAILAALCWIVGLFSSGLRSRAMLAAFDAPRPLRVMSLVRLQAQGVFLNTFLPGNVGGDLLRGHAMRIAFTHEAAASTGDARVDGNASSSEPAEGAGAGYVVVFLERVFGLAGLLTLTATTALLHPMPGIRGVGTMAAVGFAAAIGASLTPFFARRLAWLPGPLGKMLGRLPVLEKPLPLVLALALSILNHANIAVAGWLLVASVHPGVSLLDALVLVPVAAAAVYFPATVAGLGVREAAFVQLFWLIGVPRPDATAASLALLAVQMPLALAGGLAILVSRTVDDRDFRPAICGPTRLESRRHEPRKRCIRRRRGGRRDRRSGLRAVPRGRRHPRRARRRAPLRSRRRALGERRPARCVRRDRARRPEGTRALRRRPRLPRLLAFGTRARPCRRQPRPRGRHAPPRRPAPKRRARRGGELIDCSAVESVHVEGGRPTAVKVVGHGVSRTLRAQVFIDASGLHAVVRRAVLSSWPAVAPTDICTAAQEVCKIADRARAEEFMRRHEFREGEVFARTGTAGGYSTLNFRVDFAANEVSLLTGSVPGAGRGRRIPTGAGMIAELRAEHGWIGERVFGGAGALPLHGPYTRQVGTGFALLGDAGAQMFPAHGSGIGIGLRSARLLADTIIAAPRSRIGDHDVLHRFAAALHCRHGGLLDAYDLVRRLSQELTPEESEAMLRDGLITRGNAWSALAQKLPNVNVTESLAIARAATRAPKLACKLGAAMAKIPLCVANAPTYPDAPDAHALSAFEGRRARILGRSAEPVV